MKYLVDANVLAEPTKLKANPNIVTWLRRHESELAVDPIILAEVRFGIELVPKSTRRTQLEKWFAAGVQKIECLPWDTATAWKWAELVARLRTGGKMMPAKDTFIAATALAHNLPIATRNKASFEKAGLRIVEPFDA